MAKEVIYIDVNDDVTGLIDRIKNSKEKIIALVPPKQIGILQSAINLALLSKTAKASKKYLVIITNNSSLMKLAAMNKIPIAKSLQSKPGLAEIPALKTDGDDIIDGQKLPVGELDKTVAKDEEIAPSKPSEPVETKKPTAKVPNYKKFQKKLLIFGGLGVFLIAFLVWAIIFAPRAEVMIYAKTKAVNLDQQFTLTENSSESDFAKNIVHAQIQTLTKKKIVEVAVTGKKDIGQPAAGTVTLIRSVGGSIHIPAGSAFSKGDCNFVTQSEVTVAGAGLEPGTTNIVNGTAQVGVKATVVGEQCNIAASDLVSSVNGVTAQGTAMTGGTSKIIKVVSKEDMQSAQQKLAALKDQDDLAEIKNKFDSSILIIEESLTKKTDKAKASAKVDEEAKDGKLTLEQSVDYKLVGVSKEKLNQYIDHLALADIKDKNVAQKVYDYGLDSLHFKDFNSDKMTVKVVTQAKIGIDLTKDQVKEVVKGKNYGQIENHFDKIDGVEKVEVDFRPFWVRTVPNKTSRIRVDFKME